MNKRQKKKLYKKKYGHNPPSRRRLKEEADELQKTLTPACENMKQLSEAIIAFTDAVCQVSRAFANALEAFVRRCNDHLDGSNP